MSLMRKHIENFQLIIDLSIEINEDKGMHTFSAIISYNMGNFNAQLLSFSLIDKSDLRFLTHRIT